MKPSHPVPSVSLRPACWRSFARRASQAAVILSVLAVAMPRSYGAPVVIQGPAARKIALANGWPVRAEIGRQRTIELYRIVDGKPLYHVTTNADAADTISVDECQPGGSSGLGLTGSGVQLGVWDAGSVRVSHVEFGGRAQQMDVPEVENHFHATHVSGTMIAAGLNPLAKGMSPEATLACYDWTDDIPEMMAAARDGVRVSNHSYGFLTGWEWFGDEWYWFGNVLVDSFEDANFGFYGAVSREWDEMAYLKPYLLFVTSAGNDRDDGPAPGTEHKYWDPYGGGWTPSFVRRSLDGNGGYDSIGYQALSKNGLTVGAVHDIGGGYAGPGSVVMSSFSCWGPCDDGRIKPDVVGNGIQLESTWYTSNSSYDSISGTSMSSPSVAGSLGLLIQHHRTTHPDEDDMLAATLKALVIHTADEAGGAAGPDYEYGWGLVNALTAANLITADTLEPDRITEQVLSQDGVFEVPVVTSAAGGDLRVTIVWTDPAGAVLQDSLDPPNKMLVNDLDLRVEAADGTVYEPWVLDPSHPSAAASRGDNNTDNVEQVLISSPDAGTYTVRVTHKGTLTDSAQAFGLVISGIDDVFSDCNGNGVDDQQEISDGTNQDCNGNLVPDDCDLAAGTSADCDTNQIPDECEFVDCNGNCVGDDADISDGTSLDCNGNSVPDECDAASDSDDCNGNQIPDECEVGANDCNDNGVPDDCDVGVGGLLADVDFEAGLPAGWSATGAFNVTSNCAQTPTCDGAQWAYAGSRYACSYIDDAVGRLTSPAFQLGPSEAALSFCSFLHTEWDYDFAEVYINYERVMRMSGEPTGWEDIVIDLDAYRGESIVIEFKFTSDMSISGMLGWQVDNIQLLSGSRDCTGNGVPDECEMDCNGNGVADSCDLADCSDDPACADCNENGTPDSCDVGPGGGSEDANGNGVPDECECVVDAECDDNDVCNGIEFCNAFFTCDRGDPPVCDDGNSCTDDACDPITGCSNTANPANTCEDGLYCTGEQSCSADGECVSQNVPCAADEVCDEDDDECVECLEPAHCDDGLYCNGSEVCDGDDTCQPGTAPCSAGEVCDEDADDCVQCLTAADCDDGSVCNGSETCDEAGNCVAGTGLSCNDGNLCTDDSCDPTAGCTYSADDTNSCDDGLYCNGAETCVGGTCAAGTAACPEGESCDEARDACLECLEATDCDDEDDCTADTCPSGRCEHTLFPDCADDDDDGVANRDDQCASGDDTKDADGDGIPDACDRCANDADNDMDDDRVCGDADNCPADANREQEDVDGDGKGDICDPCPQSADDDVDEDGLCGDVDNCPGVANALQADADGDGDGDACDSCPFDLGNDRDEDGLCGDVDNCPMVANADQSDSDGDNVGDLCDPCSNDADNDADRDGICGDVDNCPLASNPAQENADGDEFGDACDDDAVTNPVPDVIAGEGEVGDTVPTARVCNVFGMAPLVLTFFGLVAMRGWRRRS